MIIVMEFIEAAAYPKVRNLDIKVLTYQAVSSGKVTVDKFGSRVVHGTCYLHADVN